MTLKNTMISLAVVLFTGLAFAQSNDDAVKKVDEVNLGKIERGIKVVRVQYETYQKTVNNQLRVYLNDSLAGTAGDPAAYLEPVERVAQPLLQTMDLELSENMVKMVEASLSRRDKAYGEKAQAIIEERNHIISTSIAPIREAKGKDGTKPLTLSVFDDAAEELAKSLAANTNIMKQLVIDQDRIEYFLTVESRPMWDKEKLGKVSTTWFSAERKRDMGRIMRTHLVNNQFFNAERPLEAAVREHALKDKYYSLHLLYAFVLLINESSQESVDQGFAILKEAFESNKKELDKDRSQLAFNFLRVGTRLGKLDEATFRKLLDHVRFVEDEVTLMDLYSFAMARYVQDGDLDQVAAIYAKAKARNLSDKLPAVTAMITLLHTGEYDRISTEVAADSLLDFSASAAK